MEPAAILQKMIANDPFSRWMGLLVDEIGLGSCRLHCNNRSLFDTNKDLFIQ
jgi:hypothetical protein